MDFISPASGKIVSITKNADNNYHICIFLSILDNHDQFIPYTGKCIKREYRPGEFNVASLLRKSDKNEHCTIYIKADCCTYAVIQIAGVVARTIVNKAKRKEIYKQGYKYGKILFGSRVDIIIPANKVILVCQNGQRVTGAQTILAKLK